MFLATAIVSSLLAAVLLLSGRGKLVKDPQQLKTMSRVGFPEDRLWLLAAAETAGAVGVVAGLFWWPIGVAAAAGVILYFLGAVGAHLRVRDLNFAPALVLLMAGVAALVLRVLTT
jgi:uncharacterized membrane protein YphA (DoxX/SURF4 family)